MIRHASILTATVVLMSSLSAQEPAPPAPPPVVGRWDLTLTARDGRPLPSWLEVHVSGNGVLVGWHTVGGANQWSAVSGVLTNAKGGANLVTDAVFTDFKLHVEVRYPPRGNSGVYLRGRHEVQVEDSVVTKADGEATGGLGAI